MENRRGKGRNKPNSKNRNIKESRSKKDGFKTSGSYNKPTGKPKFKKDGTSKPKFKKDGPSKPKINKAPVKKTLDGKIRLNRFLAHAGICSRREADVLIETGVVQVNGKLVTEMGLKVDPRKDVILYDGQRINLEVHKYILLNKPKDFITTSDDPKNRKTVLDLVSNACLERIYPVGRLDRKTLGLLLLTNDGDLADKLTHPRNGITKIYQIEVDKAIQKGHFNELLEGIELEDGIATVDAIEYGHNGTDKKSAILTVHSGRNRIVRRMFEHFGYSVKKLDRVAFAGLDKKGLQRGKWRHLSEQEVGFLKML